MSPVTPGEATLKVADWELERFRLGELKPARLAEIERLLRQDPALAARMSELDRSDAAIFEAYPARRVAATVQARLAVAERGGAASARRWVLPALVPVFALAAGVLILVLPSDPPGLAETAPPMEDRVKGAQARLLVYRASESGPELLADETQVHPGDVLQIAWARGAAESGILLSIDGAGNVTVHAAALPAGQQGGALPEAFELDDAPGFERFFLVTSAHAVDLRGVTRAAADLASRPDADRAPLGVPAELSVVSLLLRKESP